MRVTYGDLIRDASSSNADVRKQAYAIFTNWIKMAPRLAPDKQLTFVERDVLTKIFAQKGFASGQQQPNRRRA
jgi:predicted hydrolase (HD superfamily)